MFAESNQSSSFRRRGSCLAVLALVSLAGLLIVLAGARPAAAIGTGGPDGFGLAPAPDSQSQAPPYFSLNVAAGQSAAGLAVVFNLGRHAQALALTRSLGVTATNSGTAYEAPAGPCHGPACWVSGLPRQVRLAAGAREQVRFQVRVPRGTKPGQYLAGLTVQPAARPKPVPVGSRGGAHARAVIIRQVSVGVAVTVGLRHRLHLHRPLADRVTFPVAITTATTSPTPTAIYDADTGSGEGSNVISPAVWWVNILSDATPGTYTSTITLAISSGPVGS